MNRKLYLQIILFPVLLIVLTAAIITAFNIRQFQQHAQQMIEQTTNNFIAQKKAKVRDKVERALTLARFHHARVEALLKEETSDRDAVEAEQQRMVIEELKALDRDERTYLLVIQLHDIQGGEGFGTVLMSENAAIADKLISDDWRDAKGNRHRRDYLKLLREQGHGFLDYWYLKPAGEEQGRKMSYFHRYEPWNWVIASGFYFDDLEREVAGIHQTVDGEIAARLRHALWVSLALITLATALSLLFARVVNRRISRYSRRIEGLNQELNQRVADKTRALQESQTRLAAIIEQSPDPIFVVSERDLRVVDFNPAMCALLDYPPETLRGMSITRIDAEETPETARRRADAMRDAGTVQFIRPWRTRTGQRIHQEVRVKRIELGGQTMFLAVTRDITERMAREAKLRRFEEMVDTTQDLMAFVDADYRYRQVNLAYARAFGLPKEEVIDRALAEVLGESPFTASVRPRLDACLQGEPVRYQAWFERADGRRFMDVAYYPLREHADGPVSAVVMSERDITPLKQAEDALQRHNDSLDFLSRILRSFSSSLDLEEVLSRVLREALSVLSITGDSSWIYHAEEDELVCRHAIGPAADKIRGHRLKRGVGITGLAAETREVVVVADTRADSRHFKGVDRETGIEIRSIIALPLLFQEQLQGVLVCVDTRPDRFDQQARQLLEAIASAAAMAIHNARQFAETVTLRQRADAANRAKSAFLANMSHELRTPLNAVLGYTQILLKDPATPPTQLRELSAISSSGQYLLLLINDILDLARIEAGRFELFPAALDPSALIEQIHDQFRFKAAQKGLELKLEGLDQLPPAVTLDEKRLRQILMNLLGNAVKFTEQGGITLRVEYQKERLGIAVEDSGIGIREAELKELFSPYSQVGEAKYRRQGTGLGLAISKSLVECMGGEIRVTSRLGRGSRFSLHIPAPISRGDLPIAASHGHAEVSGYRRTDRIAQPLRILVVDDEENNRDVLHGLLLPLGFAVDLAASGAEALARVSAYCPDLVLMDIVMPEMDGLETTRRLLAEQPGLCVVAASARAFAEDREKTRAAGCRDHLAKPLEWNALIEVLGRHLPLEWVREKSPLAPLSEDLPGKARALDLRGLPPQRLEQLESLLMLGKGRALNRLADELAGEHARLAAELRERLARYDYDAILSALNAARAPAGD